MKLEGIFLWPLSSFVACNINFNTRQYIKEFINIIKFKNLNSEKEYFVNIFKFEEL